MTDEETVAQIQENPYLQYFIGYGSFREEAPFHETMIVHFHKLLDLGKLGESTS